MNIDIPYGKENIKVQILHPYEILMPNKVKCRNENKVIQEALEKPIGRESFEKFIKKSERLLIIVNDATRPTPSSKILEYLYPLLSAHPDVKFLVATGVHRAPTKEEYQYIFGRFYEIFKDRIFAHDARNEADMIFLGNSKNGTEMYINKMVVESGNVLVIGSVEPHYFAGYTGGRKSFLPGVASYKTIEMNHKLALSEKACSLALEGNPVHEDMIDAMNVLKDINVFSIQIVLTGDHRIYAATSGDLLKSFQAAIQFANKVFCVSLLKKGNIVLTIAPYPMDIDLYQSQKALDNGKLALEDNGVIILISKCRMGVGEDAFLDLFCKAETPQGVLEILGDEYKLGYHKAAKMAAIGVHAQMWAVTDLTDDIVKKAMLKPYRSVQKAIDDAVKIMQVEGRQPRVIVMPCGSLTIPVLQGGI